MFCNLYDTWILYYIPIISHSFPFLPSNFLLIVSHFQWIVVESGFLRWLINASGAHFSVIKMLLTWFIVHAIYWTVFPVFCFMHLVDLQLCSKRLWLRTLTIPTSCYFMTDHDRTLCLDICSTCQFWSCAAQRSYEVRDSWYFTTVYILIRFNNWILFGCQSDLEIQLMNQLGCAVFMCSSCTEAKCQLWLTVIKNAHSICIYLYLHENCDHTITLKQIWQLDNRDERVQNTLFLKSSEVSGILNWVCWALWKFYLNIWNCSTQFSLLFTAIDEMAFEPFQYLLGVWLNILLLLFA